ncbi:MAG: antitoxin [Demequinaceae bacterium]|nr:antitoxin [Demequinaceae bacterium]
MKLSISLTDADVALIDQYAQEGGFASRSAVVQHALSKLRFGELQGSYAAAWNEWVDEGDAEAWDSTAADGATPRGRRA